MTVKELADKLNKILEEEYNADKEVMFVTKNYDDDDVAYLDYHEVVNVMVDRGAVFLEHEYAF